MTEKEFQIFRDRAKNILAGGEADTSNTEIIENKDSGDQIASSQAIKRRITSRNQMGIKDKPQFKRKRAKVIIYCCAVSFLLFNFCFSYLTIYRLYSLPFFVMAGSGNKRSR